MKKEKQRWRIKLPLLTYNEPMIIASDPTVTYTVIYTVTYSDLPWPTVTYSDPKVTYIDPTQYTHTSSYL